MKTKFFLLIMPFLFSCSLKKNADNIELLNFSNSKIMESEIEEWIKIESTTQLDVYDSILFGKVMQVEFSDSDILVLEDGINSSILLFDREGRFKKQLLKLGTGPGEYSKIEFFVLRENSILVYDRSYQKLINYLKSDFSVFQEYKAKDYFLGGIGGLAEDRVFLVSDSELEGEVYKGYGFFDAELANSNYKPQFSGNIEAFLAQSISFFSGNSFLVQPFSNSVFQIFSDSLSVKFKIDFGVKKIPEKTSEVVDAEDFWAVLKNGSYYFAPHNLLIGEKSIGFNFFNETIDNVNFGLIQNGQAFRFSIDSDLKEIFLKPIAVREGLFHTVLLPGEYDEQVIELLDLTEVDYEKPILVSYTIGK
ncbi:MAG: 6-bladed beta-propeller [Algoriphagus aquaeductus]|uniref:6-bladed beta-propeller n=1 Tax=Algoriphagus aquaeductus TaxID=475299 RepID=UPI001BC5A443|nr:6-bladed beta-propeller [Algoriphagus sp.]